MIIDRDDGTKSTRGRKIKQDDTVRVVQGPAARKCLKKKTHFRGIERRVTRPSGGCSAALTHTQALQQAGTDTHARGSPSVFVCTRTHRNAGWNPNCQKKKEAETTLTHANTLQAKLPRQTHAHREKQQNATCITRRRNKALGQRQFSEEKKLPNVKQQTRKQLLLSFLLSFLPSLCCCCC